MKGIRVLNIKQFDKTAAREDVLSRHPKLAALSPWNLKLKISREKRRNEQIIVKSRLIQELLALRDLRNQLLGEVAEVIKKNRQDLESEYNICRTKDYYHSVLKKRKDFKAIIAERNRLYKLNNNKK